MISKDKIRQIFCSIDGFCIVFEPALLKRQFSTGKKIRKRKFTIIQESIVLYYLVIFLYLL